MIPCSYWASVCLATLPSYIALYVISVRQTRDLPMVSLFPHPASFRFHLTMDTLAFGYILPTTGRIPDLHRLETCAAGRTKKSTGFRITETCAFFLIHNILHKMQISYSSSAGASSVSSTGAKALIERLIFLSSSLKSTTFASISCPIFNTSAGFST